MINVVLYQPEIPQNTGNIMCTCMAFNCRLHLIEPLGFYLDEAHLRRAGMDYVKSLDYHIWPNWEAFAAENSGEFYYITRYGKKTPADFTYPADRDIYLVFGKESTGLPKELLYENLSRCVRIPMVAEARSLNLANCAAICVYAVCEKTGFTGLSKTEVIKGPDHIRLSMDKE
ncbi:MAG: tRNA (cytidine(34)-2'-O)-methyltransferase [Solobacterium sp.]|nr:tRNA (cytidine(34)-2'-O)-methyltransferase [Solobacterium sp.]